MRHGEEKRAQPPPFGVEALRLLPEPHEHVLHDLFGQRLVRQDPYRESVHRSHVLAVHLTKCRFVA